jgi:integrase
MEFKLVHNYNEPRQPDNVKMDVKIRCYHKRKYKYVDTGVFVESRFWDGDKVSNKHPQAASANLAIKNKLNEIENACYDYERSGKQVFDFNALKRFLLMGKDSINFFSYIEKCIIGEKKLDYKTLIKYNSNAKVLRELMADKAISEINSRDIEDLDKKLCERYARSTAARYHVFLQKYFKKALRDELIIRNPYDKAVVDKNRGESKKVFLTFKEVQAIEQLTVMTDVQKLVRDRFLYSCYTGLRISDNLALRKDMITGSESGLVARIHTIKGAGHSLIHPLYLLFDGKPEKIARLWMDLHAGDTLFPVQSRDYINLVLDLIADAAKIKKKLTFHVARHTCATMLAEITQNPFLMLQIMGWSDMRIAMNYIHSSEESAKRQLQVFEGKWMV